MKLLKFCSTVTIRMSGTVGHKQLLMSELALDPKPSPSLDPAPAPSAATANGTTGGTVQGGAGGDDAALFINRELSWLRFNQRVLGEVHDASLPLYERLKFLTIVSSNLDEFFMVRVAGLKQQMAGGVVETAADGMLPAEQLAAISDVTHAMIGDQYKSWRTEVLPALGAAG